MLITWESRFTDVEGLKGGIVVPDCCEHVRKHLTVVLTIPWRDLTDKPAFTEPDLPPLPEGADWKEKINRVFESVGEPIEGKTRFDMTEPYWAVGCSLDYHTLVDASPDHSRLPPPPVVCCPHCGTKLPEIERVPVDELPGPVHRPVADGDYCGTCDERSRACRCLYPTALWRTVRLGD